MKMTGKFVLLLAAMLALFLGQAQAQRCLPCMKGVQLMADMVDGFYCGKDRNDTGFAFGLAVSTDRKSTRLNSSHMPTSRMPSSA